MILLDVILPVFLVGGCGYLVGRSVRAEPTVLIKILFYLTGPALVFRSIYTSEISVSNAVSIGLFVVLLQGIMFGISRLIGRLRGWDGDTQASGSLVLTFANCGNYGLPVLLFAFGEQGFAFGIVFVLISIMMQATLGIGAASWHKGMPWYRGIAQIPKAPYLYAFLLAVLLRTTSVDLPLSVFRAVDLLASAAIPGQLLMLGIQLSRVRLHHFGADSILLSAIKLTVPPLLGWGLTCLLGIDGLLQSILIVEAGMPSAVNALILATNYRRNTELAATTVFISTMISLGTMTLLLMLVR
ncbi:AEC family transporter [Candidatus Bipolaricaulota bacterium]